MSAKPAPKKTRSFHYSFQLPDGKFIGRHSFHDPLARVTAHRAIPYSPEGIAAKRAEILTLFPTARIVPAPRLNEESGEWETPQNVPPLN